MPHPTWPFPGEDGLDYPQDETLDAGDRSKRSVRFLDRVAFGQEVPIAIQRRYCCDTEEGGPQVVQVPRNSIEHDPPRSSASLKRKRPSKATRGTEIRKINDQKHPANGQYGLFALHDYPNDSLVCDYIGILHTRLLPPAEVSSDGTAGIKDPPGDRVTSPHSPHASWDDSDYCVRVGVERLEVEDFDDGEGRSTPGEYEVCIDAERAGNEARFVNDFRGVAPKPNAQFRDYVDSTTGEKRFGIFAKAHSVGRKAKRGDDDAGRELEVGPVSSNRGRHKKGPAHVRDRTAVAAAESFKGIRAGEEILVSYGKGFWRGRSVSNSGNDVDADMWERWSIPVQGSGD
ncbi:hypothetical protein M427DRAFT_31128 [Gonapodya prolifera JEL478]|uniref:SET domain-containing protein n=1 Tax=Gonapodya prolifera (strain JEL478) TaxID=1344416 RepID=A0A139AI55_GONPJ|nr:hypothetical protein M427DRAFT_31128 [Gonapodya prolifera JEL478]|eukprot:KXS16389.1 hypothetical protein M427DRAFT_31128 [Gonapodya prolifera JEL478]